MTTPVLVLVGGVVHAGISATILLAAAVVCTLVFRRHPSFKRRSFVSPLRTTVLYLPVGWVPRIAASSKGVGPDIASERAFELLNCT